MEIEALEKKIDELIQLCDDLEQKHGRLESDKHDWMVERTRLLEKNAQAKTKVEAMIMRLKSLE